MKLTRDTINVLRRHPLCGGMPPTKPGAQMFWVSGAIDARNASMTAVGVNQNVTSARARDIDYDDVEVPKNIKTADARENLRNKIQEATFILVPGGRETYIGTPHTHDSIYPELAQAGATLLKIPLFERHSLREHQHGDTLSHSVHTGRRRALCDRRHPQVREAAGRGIDYHFEGGDVIFVKPPGAVLDIYAHCAWPERFTRDDIIKRRKKTRTLNYWDSQYMLEAKPITETRLDPARIIPSRRQAGDPLRQQDGHDVARESPRRRHGCTLGPASGKLNSDVSAFGVVLQG